MFVCDYYNLYYPDLSLGTAVGRLSFGSNVVTTSWGNVPLSTLAFKANNVYTPNVPGYACDPDISLSGDAPCDDSSEHVFAIPGVGYEDKILLEDTACDPQGIGGTRNGSVAEALANCHIYDTYFYSDMPAAYKDTVRFDGAEHFVPGSGSANPGQIQENATYVWVADFYQRTLEGMPADGQVEIRHNSAVTTYYPVPFTCPAGCYFNVDQTTIAPVIQYTE